MWLIANVMCLISSLTQEWSNSTFLTTVALDDYSVGMSRKCFEIKRQSCWNHIFFTIYKRWDRNNCWPMRHYISVCHCSKNRLRLIQILIRNKRLPKSQIGLLVCRSWFPAVGVWFRIVLYTIHGLVRSEATSGPSTHQLSAWWCAGAGGIKS